MKTIPEIFDEEMPGIVLANTGHLIVSGIYGKGYRSLKLFKFTARNKGKFVKAAIFLARPKQYSLFVKEKTNITTYQLAMCCDYENITTTTIGTLNIYRQYVKQYFPYAEDIWEGV